MDTIEQINKRGRRECLMNRRIRAIQYIAEIIEFSKRDKGFNPFCFSFKTDYCDMRDYEYYHIYDGKLYAVETKEYFDAHLDERNFVYETQKKIGGGASRPSRSFCYEIDWDDHEHNPLNYSEIADIYLGLKKEIQKLSGLDNNTR